MSHISSFGLFVDGCLQAEVIVEVVVGLGRDAVHVDCPVAHKVLLETMFVGLREEN